MTCRHRGPAGKNYGQLHAEAKQLGKKRQTYTTMQKRNKGRRERITSLLSEEEPKGKNNSPPRKNGNKGPTRRYDREKESYLGARGVEVQE